MSRSPVGQALARLERLLRGSALMRAPGIRAAKELLRARVTDYLSENVPVQVADFELLMPRRFLGNYTTGPYEPLTQQSFRDRLRAGMTMVDIGAHVGFYSVLSARQVGAGGRVHAFEPSDDNLAYLRRNLALNGLGNVTVHPVAAGAATCEREFHLTGSSDSHGFYRHPLTETVRTLRVRQVRPDEVVDGPVHGVKVDVEGAELEVLDGLEGLLARSPDLAIWVEWNPSCMRNAGYDPADLPRRMADLGFRLTVLDDHTGQTPALDDVLARIAGGELPEHWYVNLFGVRERRR